MSDVIDGAAADLSVVAAPLAGAEVVRSRARRNQRGMTTAEYAVGCVASVSFVGVLITVLKNPVVQNLLLQLLRWVLSQFWG